MPTPANKRLQHSIQIEVPFHDVDMMEVAWHGHYVKYFEVARCALLDQFNYNYPQMRNSGYAWPVIDLHLRYARPARFGQTITVTATVREWENRLKISYLISDKNGQRLTRGHSIQVAVDMASEEMLYVSPPILMEGGFPPTATPSHAVTATDFHRLTVIDQGPWPAMANENALYQRSETD